MRKISSLSSVLALTFGITSLARGQGAPAAAAPPAAPPAAKEHTALAPGDIKWGDAPPNLPKGAKLAVLYGDPSKDGLFIIAAKLPANYKIAPHTHPTDENVTVVSGSFAIGMGDTIDAKSKAYPAGSFFSMPAGMHHYAFTKGPTVITVSAMGPFQLNYINPADDPSKAPAAPAAPPAKSK